MIFGRNKYTVSLFYFMGPDSCKIVTFNPIVREKERFGKVHTKVETNHAH